MIRKQCLKRGGALTQVLLNVLKEAQDEHGYLSEHVLKQISIEQGVPLARLYGVARFYTMLHTEPQGAHVIEICGSPSCVLNGVIPLEKYLEESLGISIGETTADGKVSLYKTSCIGCCDESPAMLVDGEPHTKLTEERVRALLDKLQRD